MFLLLHMTLENTTRDGLRFTFHYVSITTSASRFSCFFLRSYLHSTMFLLLLIEMILQQKHLLIYIPLCFYYYDIEMEDIKETTGFTFHYVSITTVFTIVQTAASGKIYIPLCFYYYNS